MQRSATLSFLIFFLVSPGKYLGSNSVLTSGDVITEKNSDWPFEKVQKILSDHFQHPGDKYGDEGSNEEIPDGTGSTKDVDSLPVVDENTEEAKRWNSKGVVRVWGKRDLNQNEDEKRAWQKNSFRVWGKRDGTEDVENLSTGKRPWKNNKLKIWGKRSEENDDDEDVDKRAWNKNRIMVWGKRDSKPPRSWRQTRVTAWGKRGVDDFASGEVKRKWNQKMRTWGKRSDYKLERFKQGDASDAAANRQKEIDLLQTLSTNDRITIGTLSPVLTPVRKLKVELVRNGRKRRSWNSDPWSRARYISAFDGPKRSWRNNVIRVWGKRGGSD